MQGMVPIGFPDFSNRFLERDQSEHGIDSWVKRDDHLDGIDEHINQNGRKLGAGVEDDEIVLTINRGQPGPRRYRTQALGPARR